MAVYFAGGFMNIKKKTIIKTIIFMVGFFILFSLTTNFFKASIVALIMGAASVLTDMLYSKKTQYANMAAFVIITATLTSIYYIAYNEISVLGTLACALVAMISYYTDGKEGVGKREY